MSSAESRLPCPACDGTGKSGHGACLRCEGVGSTAHTSAATSIREWQARAAEWTDSRFPDDDLKQRGLVLGEETGEVLRCILKGEQDIRGGRDYWINGQLPKEAVDVFFCLAALAHRAGFDLADAIEAEWARIAAKDYIVKGALRD